MDEVSTCLFSVLDTLSRIARMMHPQRLPALVAELGDSETSLRKVIDGGVYGPAAIFALQACTGLRGAPDAANPMLQAFRALRQYSRAVEALAGLAETVPSVGRYFLEPGYRYDPILQQILAQPAHPDAGLFHSGNTTDERGGFSVYVPSWYNPARPAPVIFALHGGSGHGRLFLWNWFAEARSRGVIIVAPTAVGSTWSLMESDIDCGNLMRILARVRDRWAVDAAHMLLTGMSDGGTFTLPGGLAPDSPFTHLAPVAASFHPMLLAMTEPERLTGLPIHLTHGEQDWMFPVSGARTAYRALAAAGAAITYREIAALSHAYPRDGQSEVLDWFMTTAQPR